MPFKHSGKPISEMIRDIERMKRELPAKVGAEATSFFLENFRREGFQGDTGLERWPKREGDDASKKSRKRNLLVNTGTLRRGIQKKIIGGGVIVFVGSPADDYADVHNFGFKGSVKVKGYSRRAFRSMGVQYSNLASKKTRTKRQRFETGSADVQSFTRNMNIPQRKFIGNSKQLDKRIRRLIDEELKKALYK